MPMHSKSLRSRVLRLFMDSNRQLTAAQIIRETQVSHVSCRAFISSAYASGLISRIKVQGKNCHAYFMTPEQKHMCPLNDPNCVDTTPWPEQKTINVDAVDIPARLRFLEVLADNPVFQNYAQLHAIIADYRRTLKAIHAEEMEREEVAA